MTPNPNPSPELRERLKYYPDYIDDPDGLERFRQAVLGNSGHDMAAVNHNSLGRLIDTIERLRRERDTALSAQTLPAPPLSTDVQSAPAGFHERDVSLKVALPAPGEVEGTREALATCASMLERYVAECLPAGEDGKLHFVRVMTDATAAEIRAFLANTEK